MTFGTSLYWRATHHQPLFTLFDGRLVILIFLTVMHIRVWTIALTVSALLVSIYFARKGVRTDSILRFMRSSIVGRMRTARGPHEERSFVDFGFETKAHVDAAHYALMARHKASAKTAGKASGKRGLRLGKKGVGA